MPRMASENELLKVDVNGVTYLVSPKVTNRSILNPKTPHGRVSTYIQYGCRCDDCTAANREWVAECREDRARRLREDPTLAPHGNRSTYINWGCRCDECAEAHSEYCAVYWQKRKKRLKRR